MVAVKDAAVTEGGTVPLPQRPELTGLAAEPSQSRQLEMAAALSRGMLQRISPVYAVLRDAAAADSALRGPLTADINRRRDFQRTLAEIVHARGPFRGGLTTEQAAETYSALANPDLYLLLTTHHRWTADEYQAWLARASSCSCCQNHKTTRPHTAPAAPPPGPRTTPQTADNPNPAAGADRPPRPGQDPSPRCARAPHGNPAGSHPA